MSARPAHLLPLAIPVTDPKGIQITAHRDRRHESTIGDEEEEQQKNAAATEREEAVGQVALLTAPADANRSNTIEEDSFLGKGRAGK